MRLFHTYDASRYDFEAHTPGSANTSSATMSPTVCTHAVNDTHVPSNNNSDSTVVTNTGTDTQITNRVQPSDTRHWETAVSVSGVKMVDNVRHYKVVWQDPNHNEPSWVPEDEVSDALKTEFHITHTLRGTKRPNYRQLQGD